MVAQIYSTITTEIAYTYVDFDGQPIDVVKMTYPDGFVEYRQCWADDSSLDGETVFKVKTAKGSILKSSWEKTIQNNKWMQAYKALWLERYQSDCQLDSQPTHDELLEIEIDQAYKQAKSDLGFGWCC